MTLLLDTHVLLWFGNDDRRLGPMARTAVREGDVMISAITAWEISIKEALGRLTVPDFEAFTASEGYRDLPFTAQHGREAGRLPRHHRDPFDRALVAQARVEGLILVTAAPAVQRYDVALLDAAR